MYSVESLLCQRSFRTTTLETSLDVGWTSTLLERHRAEPVRTDFETTPTPDLTLVVALIGRHRLGAFTNGRWHEGIYNPGSAGLTAGGQSDRLRWDGENQIEMGHVFVPQLVVAEAAEALRRAGQRTSEHSLSALVFDDPAIGGTFTALLTAARSGAPDIYAEQTMHWLAMHLLSTHGSADSVGLKLTRHRLTRAGLMRTIALIRSCYAEPISLERLAAEAGVSKFHFLRLFRERTGSSPYAFLVKTRMAVARRLLESTEMPIADVARAVGYPRAAQFGLAFKSLHGFTPSAFRRQRDNEAKPGSITRDW